MNAFIASARSPDQAAYYQLLNRFLYALIFIVTAWLLVLCLQGMVLLYAPPATVSNAASWLAWVSYPPAAVELLVSLSLLALFRPREVERVTRYASPARIQRARWLLYGAFITPLALVWVA